MKRPVKPVSPKYRVALVEDKRPVRELLATLINGFPEFACACSCSSAEKALKEIPPLHPDIVLMDIFLPQMSGIECTLRLKIALPECRVLILTASDDEEMVFPALEAGADGYLLKQSKPEELHRALLEVLHDGVPMTSSIARRVAEFFRRRADRPDHVKLSPREVEVLKLIAKGYVNKEIADKLSLSVETIRSYLKNIYDKMHVHSRAEAVARYFTDRDSDKKNTPT